MSTTHGGVYIVDSFSLNSSGCLFSSDMYTRHIYIWVKTSQNK